MACANTDVDDFVTCGVCFNEYDTDDKKPKFLQCPHTICLQCLKQICRDGSITCPFCRNTFTKADVNALMDNHYVLHILKLNEKKKETNKTIANLLVVGWCFQCNAADKPSCVPLGHSIAQMTADAIKNLDLVINLKEELLKMKEQKTDNLAKAIEKRKHVQRKLLVIRESTKAADDKVQKLQDENDLRLTEMISILVRNNNDDNTLSVGTNQQMKKKNLFLSELMHFVDDSGPDDTTESLRLKMAKSVELSKQKLDEATDLLSEYDFQDTMKIVFKLYDDKDRPIATDTWLENGFRLQPISPLVFSSQVRQELILINHAITSFLRKHSVSFVSKQLGLLATKTAALSSTKPTANTANSVPSSSQGLFPFPVASQNIFVLRLFQSHIQLGEVHIQPVPTFHPEFVQKLAIFCHKTQQIFCDTIEKAMPSVYAMLKMDHPQFKPSISSMLAANQNITLRADEMDQVGVIKIKKSVGKKSSAVTGWSFIFPLNDFRNPKYAVHVTKVKAMKDNELFGRVVHRPMLEPLTQLSTVPNAKRKNLRVTLEFI